MATVIHWITVKKQRNRIMKKRDQVPPCSVIMTCFCIPELRGKKRWGREVKPFGSSDSQEMRSYSKRDLSLLLFRNQTITARQRWDELRAGPANAVPDLYRGTLGSGGSQGTDAARSLGKLEDSLLCVSSLCFDSRNI